MGDHFQVSSHGNALTETQQKHLHCEVSLLINSFIWTIYDCLVLFIYSLHIGWPLNSLMAGEELLQPPVCVSPAPSQIRLFIFQQRTSSRKKKTPNTQMSFVPVSLSVCMSLCLPLRKTWKENKIQAVRERSKQWWSPVHFITGTAQTGPAVSESSGCSHISCTHAQTCAVLYVTLVGAVCYRSGSVPSACLPTLHKPNNATLLGLLQLWPAAQWKKRRTWQGGKERCRKGHIWTTCQLCRY